MSEVISIICLEVMIIKLFKKIVVAKIFYY